MANEVTINIESSLAAMAFVVADQQEQIKCLREQSAEWENMYNDEKVINQSYTDTISVRDEEIKELKDKLHESVQVVKNLKENLDYVRKENEFVHDMTNDVLREFPKWNSIDVEQTEENLLRDYEMPFTINECPAACILVKVVFIKDGMYDAAGDPIEVGTECIQFGFPQLIGGKYLLYNNDRNLKYVAWCNVTLDNFVNQENK